MKAILYIRLRDSKHAVVFLCSCLLLISCSMKTDKTETTEEMVTPQGKGYALLVGVAKTNLSDYINEFTQSAPYNIEAMENILLKNEFEEQHIIKLHSPKADELKKSLQSQLTKMTEKDLLVFYFFGHGDQIPDTGVLDEKKDHKDEVLILADRELVDDEIYEILTSIKTKARVLFIADACNSGSPFRLEVNFNSSVSDNFNSSFEIDPPFSYLENIPDNEMKLDFLYLGATQDGSNAITFGSISQFTSLIEATSKSKSFEGNYKEFFNIISEAMLGDAIFPTFDPAYASSQFLDQQPFKIN